MGDPALRISPSPHLQVPDQSLHHGPATVGQHGSREGLASDVILQAKAVTSPCVQRSHETGSQVRVPEAVPSKL